MTEPRIFKLRLSQGMQTVRLDPDSLDYDWKGSLNDFHGTLPYENLRLKMRVTRKDKTSANLAALGGFALLVVIVVLFPHASDRLARLAMVAAGTCLINLIGYVIRQAIRSRRICVQIEPRPFGFSGELPVPDTKKGRAFLAELEEHWKESLRRRFLIHDDRWLNRLQWLENIGVLTSEEAEAERALASNETQPEEKLIGFAVN